MEYIDPENRQLKSRGVLSNCFLMGYDQGVPLYNIEAYDRTITDRVINTIYAYLEKINQGSQFMVEVFR